MEAFSFFTACISTEVLKKPSGDDVTDILCSLWEMEHKKPISGFFLFFRGSYT